MTVVRHGGVLSAVLLLGCFCPRCLNADGVERTFFRVEAVSGNRVFLDHGLDMGLQPGQLVVLHPPGRDPLTVTIESVRQERAAAVLPQGTVPVAVGVFGTILSAADQSSTGREQTDAPGVLFADRPPAKDPSAGQRGPQSIQRTAPGRILASGLNTRAGSPGAIRRVEVRVTATSGGSVFLDRGRDAGIEPGDDVLLYPPTAGIVNGTIQTVSKNHSRCTVSLAVGAIDIGTRGAVLVPEDRARLAERERADVEGDSADRRVPDHPPWSQPPEEWDEQTPLLAPAYSEEPNERSPRFYGRVFAQYLHTLNMEPSSNQYSLGRIGSDIWLENPFRRGGALHLDGEFNRRNLLLDTTGSEIDSPGRIDRFSYRWEGNDRYPFRVEIGRFLHHEIPELEVVDGVEIVHGTASSNRVGFSLGAMPEPFPDMKTGDDLQASVFYRFVSGEEEDLTAAIAYQKTWHRGTPDRDLVVGTLDYTSPDGLLFIHEAVLGDFYTPSDNLKTRDFEITETYLNAMLRLRPDRGVGGHFSQIRWPQLLRTEFLPFSDSQIRRDRVTRYGLFGWQEFSDVFRIDGRVDRWEDQDDQAGITWDSRLALRNWLYENGEVALTLYDINGVFTSGFGSRVTFYKYFAKGFASFAYDINGYASLSGPDGATQHAVLATLDYTFAHGRSVSLSGDYRFGARQNSLGAGLFLQQRF